MKRALTCLAMVLLAFPLFAVDRSDCGGPLTELATLYQIRSMMMKRYTSTSDIDKFIDRRIEDLREPLPGGGYRWVRWTRPSGEGTVDKKVHVVSATQGAGDPDVFEASGQHAYGVRIVVPSKRSLFKGNNRVYVGDVQISWTDASGRRRNGVMRVNRWMNPDTSQTYDLDGIYDNVSARAEVSAEARDAREAVSEIHFRQAVATDDPANPAYDTIRSLDRLRGEDDPAVIDSEIASLESSLFPGTDTYPLLSIMRDLRKADEWTRSSKADEQEKGQRLLKETLRRLR